MISKQKIEQQVCEWVNKNIGENFSFRQNQLDVICEIVYEKINNIKSHHILQAPTGSGKSIINIVCAGVLWTYYNKNSYILCTDLFLYKQYVDFINTYKLQDFSYIKGQTGNYLCAKAKNDVRHAYCKLSNVSYAKLYEISSNQNWVNSEQNPSVFKSETQFNFCKKMFNCINNCIYMQERFDAASAPITLMTYDLFYFQMNIAGGGIKSVSSDKIKNTKILPNGSSIVPTPGSFVMRDYIFCDEAHNIPNIIQARCKPTISYNDIQRILKIYKYYKSLKNGKTNKLLERIPNENDFINIYTSYWQNMCNNKLSSYDNTILLFRYMQKIVDPIYICGGRLQKIFSNKILKGLNLNPIENEIYSDIVWLQNYHCFLDDFCRAIQITGFTYTYKQINMLKKCVSFGTVKEDGIIYCFLLRFGLYGTTLTSATMGNIDVVKENFGYKFFESTDNKILALKNYANSVVGYIDVPSTFDFSNSPIYIDDSVKVNFKNKDVSTVDISKKVSIILDSHKNSNGIIQTGSYEIANKIFNNLSKEQQKRILLYKNAAEKREIIYKITKNTNFVLMGPSLTEGIDLPGALCDFVIIAKVPFLSLADKYVTSKMKVYKKWYNSVAITNIIQGIGRGNRFANDTSSTYIIDGSFKRLYSYTKKQVPEYIKNRFIYKNISSKAA